MGSRLQLLQATLAPDEALLLSCSSDVFYFFAAQISSHEREALAVVTGTSSRLLHSPLIKLPRQNRVKYVPNMQAQDWQAVGVWLASKNIRRVLFDESDLRVRELRTLRRLVRAEPSKASFQFVRQDRTKIWQLCQVKSEDELAVMRRAGRITAEAVATLRAELAPGITERLAARRLDTLMGELGANATSFPTIVAFADHTANPHHTPEDTALAPEMPVLIDCGAQLEGYCSDLTRTFWFGSKPSATFTQIEIIVHAAYTAGVAELQHTCSSSIAISAKKLDQTVRTVIEQAGFGEHFIHTTGHGLGATIHEPPAISPADQTTLTAGMVLTVEPGIYLANTVGYRHENTIALQKKTIEILT